MQNIDITCKPAVGLIAFFSILFFVSMAIILWVPLPVKWQVAMIMATLLYTIFIIWQDGLLLSPRRILRFRSIDQINWMIYTRQSGHIATLDGHTLLTRWILVLRFSPLGSKAKYTSILFKRQLSEPLFKRLIMMIRFG